MRRLIVIVLFAGVLAPPAGAQLGAAVVVDASSVLGPSNQHLIGVGWNNGTLDGVAPLGPHQVRIDASLERASSGPDALDLTDLKTRVAAVRALGAEPLVILSYMPRWLGEPRAFGRDPTRVAPSDPDAWEALIERVVRELATASAPAYRFEVWNEPDIPIFWQDSPAAFVDTAVRTHRAVARVKAETSLPLQVGGPATAFPDPAFLFPYLGAVRAEGVGIDFVSWHYYGNYPFLGPDGAESIVPEILHPVLPVWGRRNPATTPSFYGDQIRGMRDWTQAALAGSGLEPELWITEWNLSAGGLDVRHDSHEGAAFDAGVLIAMEREGLDGADFYRASNDPGEMRPGDWGLVTADGFRKPAWWVFEAWRATAGDRLAVTGDDPRGGLSVRATSGPGRIDVLLASFVASGGAPRDVDLRIDGTCTGGAEVRRIDADSSDLSGAEPLPSGPLRLPPQSVTWVRFQTC